MSENDKIHRFICGLRRPTSAKVAFDEPKTLEEAKKLASKYEHHFIEALANQISIMKTKIQVPAIDPTIEIITIGHVISKSFNEEMTTIKRI